MSRGEPTLTRATDFDMDEPVTAEVVAEAVGVRATLVVRLARSGLLETIQGEAEEELLPRRAVLRLRQMQHLRRDLGVNFAGASVILDLVDRILRLDRELGELRRRAGD